jgi:hypothetical protein
MKEEEGSAITRAHFILSLLLVPPFFKVEEWAGDHEISIMEEESGTPRDLLADLPQPLLVLQFPWWGHEGDGRKRTTYYVLGTAHISRTSAANATMLIQRVQPQAS